MYTDEDLNSAVESGVLSADAVEAFRAHVAKLEHTYAADEEHFRLISGFNDIFVVIACALLLTSVAFISNTVQPWLGSLSVCVGSWLLSEFFVARRRMALPAIVLLIGFVSGTYYTCFLLMEPGSENASNAIVFASIAAAIAAWLHWKRFHVPITVAAGAAFVVIGSIVALLSFVPEFHNWVSGITFIAGLAVFFYALHWDASDTKRQTRRSDVAFWLHLLAAPLLVHPIFTHLGAFTNEIGIIQSLGVIVLYVFISLMSLSIDRRALMVSALGYVLYAFSALLSKTGIVSLGFAITALIVGSALLLLSAFWHKCRVFAISKLPSTIQTRLAPLR